MTPERGKEILYLTQDEVVSTGITRRELIELVRVALIEHGHGRCEMPAKIGIHPQKDTLMHAMPAWVPEAQACGIKWAACFPDNYRFSLPQTSGLIVMCCPETGYPICLMDAIWVTGNRTPAVTALACEKLARQDTREAGIIGAGVQGRVHVEMLPEVLPNLECIKVMDRFRDVAEGLYRDLQPSIGDIRIKVCDTIEEVVRGSLVVVTAAAILAKPKPEIEDDWVEPGAFLAPIDFDTMWQWRTFERADKFIVDSLEEMEYFMTVGYLPNGLPPLHGEIGEVVAGIKAGREHDDELIVDMNIGMGVEDVVVATEIFKRACERDMGRLLPL